MEKIYDHRSQEPKIYQKWQDAGVFIPEKGLNTKKETFCVLMPPPNANAPLHTGHATYSIQDVYARYKRMQGYKTLYLPGTDHAGFETQVVYERKLKKEGKSRFDFDRQTLFNDILSFVKENSNIAIDQLKRLGMSADWNRNTFMLDDFVIDTVYNTFIKMHKDKLIYRDDYLVNYSPFHGTTFSNLETTHKETISSLFYVSYKIKNSDEKITVATTRPETIYADVAIAVNPKDKRYKHFVGKTALNPLNGREIKIIEDSYVDIEFGTGALKITPGHDFNDFEIGKRHKLEFVSVINLEGRMTVEAGEVAGMKPEAARAKVVEILKEKGALEKIDESYKNNLLVDYKDEKPIEPMLLPNWFINIKPLAKKAIDAVSKNKVKFNKPTWKKQILTWLEDIKDWPISRQTIFGIQIPVYYSISENKNLFVVFIDDKKVSHDGNLLDLLKQFSIDEIKSGLQKVIAPKDAVYKVSKIDLGNEYIQETDTFDTWFSSGQWPLTTLKYPDGKDFKEFYPTSLMDSMWDILFFWIARMIMFGLYLTSNVPYKNVYIHGAITDEKGKKMSKSKGNAIDPMEYVDKYGADALRMAIMVGGNTSAKTTALTEGNIKAYRNFGNKIWNIVRFLNMMIDESGKEILPYSDKMNTTKEDKEIISSLNDLVKSTTKLLDSYELMGAGEGIYQFVWHELADKYVESIKDREDKEVTLSVLRHVICTCLKLLHPFMPFVTEAVWNEIPGVNKPILALSTWPKA